MQQFAHWKLPFMEFSLRLDWSKRPKPKLSTPALLDTALAQEATRRVSKLEGSGFATENSMSVDINSWQFFTTILGSWWLNMCNKSMGLKPLKPRNLQAKTFWCIKTRTTSKPFFFFKHTCTGPLDHTKRVTILNWQKLSSPTVRSFVPWRFRRVCKNHGVLVYVTRRFWRDAFLRPNLKLFKQNPLETSGKHALPTITITQKHQTPSLGLLKPFSWMQTFVVVVFGCFRCQR